MRGGPPKGDVHRATAKGRRGEREWVEGGILTALSSSSMPFSHAAVAAPFLMGLSIEGAWVARGWESWDDGGWYGRRVW